MGPYIVRQAKKDLAIFPPTSSTLVEYKPDYFGPELFKDVLHINCALSVPKK